MKGKTLNVIEYNLTYGTKTRQVNVFSLFRYKINNNLYVVYTDVDTKYELVYYGSSHIKNNSILSMTLKEEEGEIIKEYIYKLTNNQPLDNFEIIDIKEATGIEIVSSNKLEVKLDIIRKLEELTIEKPTPPEESKKSAINPEKQKKKSKKTLQILLILIFIILLGGGTFYLTKTYNNTIAKKIICTKTYKHSKLKATIEETNTYNFLMNDILKDVNSTHVYTFNTKRAYESFINTGNIHKYPENVKANSFDQNNENNSITYYSLTNITTSYKEPKEYETLINYYMNNGYNCKEEIEK